MLQIFPGLCKQCEMSTVAIAAKASKPISATTPLCAVSSTALIQEVKNSRKKIKEQAAQLKCIKQKLQSETVTVADDVKVQHFFLELYLPVSIVTVILLSIV